MRIYGKSVSFVSGLKQNLEPNWQLFAKMSIFDEDFRSLMLPLSLTLNHEPVNGYILYMSKNVFKMMIKSNASFKYNDQKVSIRRLNLYSPVFLCFVQNC